MRGAAGGASAVRGASAGPGWAGTPATGVVLGHGGRRAMPRRRANGVTGRRVGWVREDKILGLYS